MCQGVRLKSVAIAKLWQRVLEAKHTLDTNQRKKKKRGKKQQKKKAGEKEQGGGKEKTKTKKGQQISLVSLVKGAAFPSLLSILRSKRACQVDTAMALFLCKWGVKG